MENTQKFTDKATIYSKARPTYPQHFFDYLYEKVGFNNTSIVADIGSGTGILSKELLARGTKVFCVEPNDDMRKTAESNLKSYPHFISVNASAESTTLENASVDFVTVAQAFHWFDKNKFRTECARIVKPQGKVVLVWNSRTTQNPLTHALTAVNKTFCSDFKGFAGGSNLDPASFSDFFQDGHCDFCTFQNNFCYEEEKFIDYCLSASYAPTQNDVHYTAYINELKSIFLKYGDGNHILVPTVTCSYVGTV